MNVQPASRTNRVADAALAVLAAAVILVLGWHISMPCDIWWQLANGRLIVEQGGLVRADVFTFTIPGAPYLDKYWLSEVLFFLLYQAAGWAGLVALRLILPLLCMAAVLYAVRREPRWALLLAAAPVLLLLDLRYELRPYWFTFILLPLFLRLARDAFGPDAPFRGRSLVPLLAVQWLWTQLHGEFFWGPIIALLFCAESLMERFQERTLSVAEAGRRAGAVAAVAAVTLINPFGWNLHLGLLEEARQVGTAAYGSEEWAPFFRFPIFSNHLAWGMLVVLAAGSAVAAGRRVPLAANILFWLAAALCWQSFRQLGLMALAGIFAVMENMSVAPKTSPEAGRRLDGLARGGAFLAGAALMALAVTGDYHAWRGAQKKFGFGILNGSLPVDAADFVASRGLRGNFINSWSDGGYLMWKLTPAVRIAEDGRTAPFPADLHELLRRVRNGDEQALDRLESRFVVDGAVVPWHHAGFTRLLAARPEWRLVFLGAHDTVWMKASALQAQGQSQLAIRPGQLDAYFIPALPAESSPRDPSPAEQVYRRALVFLSLGNTPLAVRQIAVLRACRPDDFLVRKFDEALGMSRPPSPAFGR